MSLLNLAPDIQEEILFLPEFAIGHARLTEGICNRSRGSELGAAENETR